MRPTPRHPLARLLLCAGCCLFGLACRDGARPPAAAPDVGATGGPAASRPTVPPCTVRSGAVQGRLTSHATWCGEIRVTGNVLVPRGVTLTIAPGTRVLFAPYRGYREPERRLTLRVEGRLLARGSPQSPVRLTSGHRAPRNGDWSMVKLVRATGSKLRYTIVEFAQHGLNLWHTDAQLDHVVLRYNNWEGLYAENGGRVRVTNSRFYANGYNCVAVEQQVQLELHRSYVASCGTAGVMVDASTATLDRVLFEGSLGAVAVDNDARATVTRCTFTGMWHPAFDCGTGNNKLVLGGNVYDGAPDTAPAGCAGVRRLAKLTPPTRPLVTGVREGLGGHLGYVPGHPTQDPYPYVYPDADETRQVTRRIGGHLGLTWSLAWDGTRLWTASLEGELIQLDPRSGKVLARHPAPCPQPWGLAHDGKQLWVNGFARRRIYAVDPRTGRVLRSFPAPDPAGGCKGLAHDGKLLYALGWATHRLYGLDPRSGKVVRSVPAPARDLGGGVRIWAAGGLTWDGAAFWAPADHLVRFDREGKIRGWIYATSERVWDLTWDGRQLWTTQRANERWEAFPRIFRVRVRQLKAL